MTAAQTKLYWFEVKEWREARGKAGLPCDEHARHELHNRALGFHKSSKDFTNLDLDKVLGALRAVSRSGDLNAQLRVEANEDERKAAALSKCEAACYQLYALGDDRLRYPENRERYMAAVCRRINFCGPEDCTAAQMEKVAGALNVSLARAQKKKAAPAATPAATNPLAYAEGEQPFCP